MWWGVQFECSICHEKILQVNDEQHHHCPECTLLCGSRELVADHQRQEHTASCKCRLCGALFTRIELQDHMNSGRCDHALIPVRTDSRLHYLVHRVSNDHVIVVLIVRFSIQEEGHGTTFYQVLEPNRELRCKWNFDSRLTRHATNRKAVAGLQGLRQNYGV